MAESDADYAAAHYGDMEDYMAHQDDQIDSDEEDDSGRFASPHIFP